jgi:hypothetical protein
VRVRRPAERKRVQMLVAYGVRRDGTRHLLASGKALRKGLEGEEPTLIEVLL